MTKTYRPIVTQYEMQFYNNSRIASSNDLYYNMSHMYESKFKKTKVSFQ